MSWNQKNLDYEIETFNESVGMGDGYALEIKRTSITRLKLIRLTLSTWRMRLEIKRTSITRLKPGSAAIHHRGRRGLEIKRTSITRLKQYWCYPRLCVDKRYLKSKEPRLRDWNSIRRLPNVSLRARLEIKRTSITRLKQNTSGCFGFHGATWNQKNLDYEIETIQKVL